MGKEELRELIFKEIMEYHEPRTPTLSFNACLKPVPKTQNSLVSTTETHVSHGNRDSTAFPSETSKSFKSPLSVIKTEQSLAVFTSNLQTSNLDIEMLSAKQQGLKSVDTDHIKTEEKKPENKKSENKPHETTISSDTKALVKAALLNSNLKKQRTGTFLFNNFKSNNFHCQVGIVKLCFMTKAQDETLTQCCIFYVKVTVHT